jgi:hypothetical protein
LLADVRDAVARGSEDGISTVLIEELIARKIESPERAQSLWHQAEVVAELHYRDHGDSTLASALFLPPGRDYGLLFLAYTGDPYSGDAFEVVERFDPSSDEGIEVVLFVRPPASDSRSASASIADALASRSKRLAFGLQAAVISCELIGAFLLGIVAGAALAAFADRVNRAFRTGGARAAASGAPTALLASGDRGSSVEALISGREQWLRGPLASDRDSRGLTSGP